MKTHLQFSLVGDEEKAREYMGVAASLHSQGVSYYAPDSMTEILIHQDTATITVHMDCPYHLMVPQTYEGDVTGLYEIGLIGYSHRKDSLVPSGMLQSSYVGYEGDFQYGNEMHYMTDGITVSGACVGQGLATSLYPEAFEATVVVGSAVTEDVLNARHGENGTGSATPQGFRPTKRYFSAVRTVGMQGQNTFGLVPHKADRTGDNPAYTALLGYSYLASNQIDQYSGETLVTSYHDVQHRIGYVTEGRDGASYGAYYLADDFIAVSIPADWSSCWPVMWNVSNGKTVMLHRYRINNSAKWFGGSFGLKLILVEGPAITLYDLSASPLLTGYSYAATFSMTPEDYPDTTITYGYATNDLGYPPTFAPHDYIRMGVMLFDFGLHSKKAAVVTTDGTIVTFSRRLRLHRHPTNQAVGSKLCCFAITEYGITQLSVLATYWDYAEFPADAGVARTDYVELRAIAISTTTILLFYDKQVETYAGSWSFVSVGWFRRVSTDGGVNWAAEEQVSFSGVAALWEWSRPRLVVDGEAVGVTRLIAGYISKTVAGATKTYADASVLLSEDGGLTWTLSPMSAPNINYQAPAGAVFVNGDAGLGTLHNHGCWEDGYEPSPHKHLPNFYGTPTAICRDSTNDAGL